MSDFTPIETLFAARLASAPAPQRPRWALRFQIQEGRDTLASDGAPCRSPAGDATVADAHAALGRCEVKLRGTDPGVARAAREPFGRMARVVASKPPSGVSGGHLNFARREFQVSGRLHRLDAENMIGHNLKC